MNDGQISSCGERLVKFFQQLRQRVAEELMGFPEAAFLVEGRVVEVVQLDAEAGGDGVEDSGLTVPRLWKG
jgi:hypothetical protein